MRISDWSSDVCSSDLTLTSHNFLQFSRHNRLSLELDQFFQGRPISPNSCHGPPWPENTGYMLSLLGTVSPSRSIWCGANDGLNARSEERRVGKECVSTFRFRCSPSY